VANAWAARCATRRAQLAEQRTLSHTRTSARPVSAVCFVRRGIQRSPRTLPSPCSTLQVSRPPHLPSAPPTAHPDVPHSRAPGRLAARADDVARAQRGTGGFTWGDTASSLIVRLPRGAAPEVHLCLAHPCCGVFLPVPFGADGIVCSDGGLQAEEVPDQRPRLQTPPLPRAATRVAVASGLPRSAHPARRAPHAARGRRPTPLGIPRRGASNLVQIMSKRSLSL
jgi:hypothetical protein